MSAPFRERIRDLERLIVSKDLEIEDLRAAIAGLEHELDRRESEITGLVGWISKRQQDAEYDAPPPALGDWA